MNAQATPPPTRAWRRCLTAVVIIVIACLAGCGKSSSSPEQEARSYISSKGHTIDTAKLAVEHVLVLVSGSEIVKGAQEAHNELERVHNELLDRQGTEKLKHATFELSEGANELKDEMSTVIAYIRKPSYATVERMTAQRVAARRRWNAGVEEIWHLANESGAKTFK